MISPSTLLLQGESVTGARAHWTQKHLFFFLFFSISYKQSYVQSRHQTETYLNVGMVRSDELIIRPCSEVPIKWS